MAGFVGDGGDDLGVGGGGFVDKNGGVFARLGLCGNENDVLRSVFFVESSCDVVDAFFCQRRVSRFHTFKRKELSIAGGRFPVKVQIDDLLYRRKPGGRTAFRRCSLFLRSLFFNSWIQKKKLPKLHKDRQGAIWEILFLQGIKAQSGSV